MIEDALPLVIVEGFLSSLGSVTWPLLAKRINGFQEKLKGRKILFPSVGPVSSLHDRACELFYAIKGGTVDYGEEHSRTHGHKRYGRSHLGLYPDWSPSKPLHFMGHSIGGATIVKLSHLLSTGFFGRDHNADMLASVIAVSAPFRGTQLVYTLGERSDAAPAVRPLSIGSMIGKLVHVLSYLSPFLGSVVDLHADARELSYRDASFASFLMQLWRSDWAESRDATPFDMTFEAADDRESNLEGRCNPATYYVSFANYVSKDLSEDKAVYLPSISQSIIAPPLTLSAAAIASFDFSTVQPPPSFHSGRPHTDDIEYGSSKQKSLGAEYRASDGVVPLFSQWHPHQCRSSHCIHHSTSIGQIRKAHLSTSNRHPTFEPGVWNVFSQSDAHHCSQLPLWVGTNHQHDFWDDLHHILCLVDISLL